MIYEDRLDEELTPSQRAKRKYELKMRKPDSYYLKELRETLDDWFEINGYSNYFINKNGDVYFSGDVSSKNRRRSRFITKTLNSNGYYVVSLNRDKLLLHRLIAETFIPNPNNYPEIDHKDRNPLNNEIYNLRWVTHKENLNNENTRKHQSKVHIGNKGYWKYPSKLIAARKIKITSIDENTDNEETFNSMTDCAKFFKISIGYLSNLIKKNKKYKGNIFIKNEQ